MNNQSTAITPESIRPTNGAGEDLRQEVERLRADKLRVESERDEYRKALYALLRSQFKPEDTIIPALTDCVPLRDVVKELNDLIGHS